MLTYLRPSYPLTTLADTTIFEIQFKKVLSVKRLCIPIQAMITPTATSATLELYVDDGSGVYTLLQSVSLTTTRTTYYIVQDDINVLKVKLAVVGSADIATGAWFAWVPKKS